VIERIFGVVKRKYQILRTASEYSLDTQTRVILACCTLHNYVRSLEGIAADYWLETESQEGPATDIQPTVSYPKDSTSSKKMDKFRDELALHMWEQYQSYITNKD
jgi:hypothetical protein